MEIEVAPYGWRGKAWDGFYPDDLPPEWRLEYLANEFFAAVVPYSEWAEEPDDVLLGWVQQVSGEFLFYWELPTGEKASVVRLQQLRRDEAFNHRWGGVLEPESDPRVAVTRPLAGTERMASLYLDENRDLRSLRALLEEAMAVGGDALLVVVAPSAAASLRPVRDLTQLLGGG